MKNVKALLKLIYDWNKFEYWLTITACVFSGILMSIFEINVFIQMALIVLLWIKSFFFIKTGSVMPVHGADYNQFSWKYMQSIPLNKIELLFFLALANLFAISPMLVWFFSFNQILLHELFNLKEITCLSLVKTFLTLILFPLITGNSSVTNLIQYPRQQFVKINQKIINYLFIRNMVVLVVIALYFVIFFLNYGPYINLNFWAPIFRPIIGMVTLTFNSLGTWSVPIVAALLVLLTAHRTVKIWQKEILSYKKIDWRPRRDFSIIVGGFILLYLPLESNLLDVPPAAFRTHEIYTAIHRGDEASLKNLLTKNVDVNQKNEYGLTPLLAASYSGRLNFLKLLQEKGARREGRLNLGKKDAKTGSNILILAVQNRQHEVVEYLLATDESPNSQNDHHKYRALHVAASKCYPEIVDHLLDKGADINVKTAKGHTPLHLALHSGCLRAVISLYEAGANPLEKDPEGRTAFDYIEKSNSDMAFYLQKRSRHPATIERQQK